MQIYQGYDAYFKAHPPRSHQTLSFHHHLRNGDDVLCDVMAFYQECDRLTLMPSSLFPVHAPGLTRLIEEGRIDALYTNYLSGPLAHTLRQHPLKGQLHLDTHGGRAHRLMNHITPLDVAYLAVPAVDHHGRLSGLEGPSACGSLGYATADANVAKRVVVITDHYVEALAGKHFTFPRIDAIIVTPRLGQRQGIESGTTKMRLHPLHDVIARKTMHALDTMGLLKDTLSFQTGAGSISLRITALLKDYLAQHHYTARFASGGITALHTQMLQEGLVKKLYDVQCFDLAAVESLRTHPKHHAISAYTYATLTNPKRVISDLDIVFLGAAQIDLEFNVNVTTDYDGTLIGGSGGHADTAMDAKLTVVVSPLLKGRMPLILDRVTTITTPGEHIDLLVTEYGVAIHPNRQDLWALAQAHQLPVMTIEALKAKAESFAGTPAPPQKPPLIGITYDRINQPLDTL